MRIGVLSDTHGLVRREMVTALTGVDLLIHAGDVGDASTLRELRALGPPLHAVRGNVDTGPWALELPENEVVEADGHRIYVLHDVAALDLDPGAARFAAVLYGHSHRPEIRRERGILYLNPGSCGPRRFSLPVTVALLDATSNGLTAEIVELAVNRNGRAPRAPA
jgi:putative phosphoesterase